VLPFGYTEERRSPNPRIYVFLSERGGKPLALRTVQATLKTILDHAIEMNLKKI
jgi:hypothetical protein